jgi:hypothetical protein
MSKKSSVFLVVIIFLTLLSFSYAEKNIWKKTVFTNSDDPWSVIYEAKVNDTNCIVGVKMDGTGVRIGAEKFTLKKNYLHAVDTTMKDSTFAVQIILLEKKDYNIEEGNRWIYSEECLGITQQLPQPVRDKFHGSMGVK